MALIGHVLEGSSFVNPKIQAIELDPMEYNYFDVVCTDHVLTLQEMCNQDLMLAGLDVDPWAFGRGMKTARSFLDQDGNKVATVRYIYSADSDLGKLEKCIDFFTKTGDIGACKNITKRYSPKALKAIGRKIRQGQLDYLESFGEANPTIAVYVDMLFTFFESQIRNYIERGTGTLLESINSHTPEIDPQIYGILHGVARPVGSPGWTEDFDLTIINAMVYQITGEYVEAYKP